MDFEAMARRLEKLEQYEPMLSEMFVEFTRYKQGERLMREADEAKREEEHQANWLVEQEEAARRGQEEKEELERAERERIASEAGSPDLQQQEAEREEKERAENEQREKEDRERAEEEQRRKEAREKEEQEASDAAYRERILASGEFSKKDRQSVNNVAGELLDALGAKHGVARE